MTRHPPQGLHEIRAITFADAHAAKWQLFILRPGGVLARGMVGAGVVSGMLGVNWTIRSEELGAAVVRLAVEGSHLGPIVDNADLVRLGKEALILGTRA